MLLTPSAPLTNHSPDDDASLLESVRAGSVEALGDLYTRFSGPVFQLAYRICASTEDAEDVLQDLFLGLPRALEGYRELGRFESWIKRVTARTALMRLRSERRRRHDPVESMEFVPAGEDVPVVERIAVGRALEEMPESLRLVFALKEIEGYSHAEISELLGITSGASAARLSRAWTFLRNRVGPS